MNVDTDLINAMAELDENTTLELVREKIKAGESPLAIIEQCRRGVELVGKKYSEFSYYLSDLIMAEEIFRGVMEIIQPYFPERVKSNGVRIVMGTIEGDIHDLGKNIIISMLQSTGYEVYDLGVDVQPERFINEILVTGANILGISVVLTYSINAVKKTIRLIEEAGLRERVTVVIGGYPVNESIRQYTGADYYETDPMRTLALMEQIAFAYRERGTLTKAKRARR